MMGVAYTEAMNLFTDPTAALKHFQFTIRVLRTIVHATFSCRPRLQKCIRPD